MELLVCHEMCWKFRTLIFFFAETEGTPYICNLHIIWHLLILMTSLKNSLIFYFILNHSLYWFKNLFGEDFFCVKI